jgi:hypothetical protein
VTGWPRLPHGREAPTRSTGEEPVPYAWIADALRASAPRVDDLLVAPQV